jgi:hypothetical protein
VLLFEVLPSANFSAANIQVVNSYHGILTAFLVKFSNTIQIPAGGKIIVGFPTRSLDGSIRYFRDDLTSTIQTNGNPFTCTTNNYLLGSYSMDCRIYKNKGI